MFYISTLRVENSKHSQVLKYKIYENEFNNFSLKAATKDDLQI